MPEISKNAAILIATSFQALNRARIGDKSTMLVNCTVTLLFASLFIEESLDVIIAKMDVEKEMNDFFRKRENEHLGLLKKALWFFNQYLAVPKAHDKDSLQNLERKLYRRFPGFQRLCQIRNDIAHGKVNRRLTLKEAEKLREQAKSIVDDFLEIAQSTNCEIVRNTTYLMAIESDRDKISEDKA
jgi:hypothetical protein